jgi:nicotinamide mononucleotide transporter
VYWINAVVSWRHWLHLRGAEPVAAA